MKCDIFRNEYTGAITENMNIKVTESFKKAFKKHLQDKYHSNNIGEGIRTILEDYLNKQCLSRQDYYGWYVVTVIGADDVGNGEIGIFDVRQLDEVCNYPRLYAGNIKDKQALHKMFDTDTLHALYTFADNFNGNGDIRIACLPLNNHLDVYSDGSYSGTIEDNTKHIGFTEIRLSNGKIFIIKYTWMIDSKPTITNIEWSDVGNIEKELYDIGNYGRLDDLQMDISEFHKEYPTDTIKNLQQENVRIAIEISDLQKKLEKNNAEIERLKK